MDEKNLTRAKLKCMFLDWKQGTSDDGGNYYMGNFVESYSSKSFKLYFKSPDKLKTFKRGNDYEFDVIFYINKNGLWSLKVVE